MNDKYRDQWEKLGADDPYWAVLTNPKKKGGKWESNEFFYTGKYEIDAVLEQVNRLNVTLEKTVALDFGCGVGRLSRALAGVFGKVMAVDVSSSMLDEAKKANQDIKNIEFVHNTSENLQAIASDSIDFLYSNIVLQHMPKSRQEAYIQDFCRVLKPGGLMAIQTPSKVNLKAWQGWLYCLLGNKLLNIVRRLKYGPSGVMEVHSLPRHRVLEILQAASMEVIHIERFDSAGTAFESYRYFAKKC